METSCRRARLRILVGEPDEDEAGKAYKAIRALGCVASIHVTNTGERALEQLRTGEYAGAILSYNMGDISGGAVADAADAEGLKTPIGIFTERADVARIRYQHPTVVRVLQKSHASHVEAYRILWNDLLEILGMPVVQLDATETIARIRRDSEAP